MVPTPSAPTKIRLQPPVLPWHVQLVCKSRSSRCRTFHGTQTWMWQSSKRPAERKTARSKGRDFQREPPLPSPLLEYRRLKCPQKLAGYCRNPARCWQSTELWLAEGARRDWIARTQWKQTWLALNWARASVWSPAPAASAKSGTSVSIAKGCPTILGDRSSCSFPICWSEIGSSILGLWVGWSRAWYIYQIINPHKTKHSFDGSPNHS